jgi:hypothetical protein
MGLSCCRSRKISGKRISNLKFRISDCKATQRPGQKTRKRTTRKHPPFASSFDRLPRWREEWGACQDKCAGQKPAVGNSKTAATAQGIPGFLYRCATRCIPCPLLYEADILPWSRAEVPERRKRSPAPNGEFAQNRRVEASPLTWRWMLGANGSLTHFEVTRSYLNG